MRIVCALCVLLVMAIPQSGLANVPPKISYQGVLRNADGTIVDDGDYDITFKLYDSAVGGVAYWEETQTLPVADGILNALLGSETPFSTGFMDASWLGISVDEDPELEPRVELVSVPYAFRAATADVGADWDWEFAGADIYRMTGKVGIGTSAPARKLHVYEDVSGSVGARIENPSTSSTSIAKLDLTDELGNAIIGVYDDGHAYAGAFCISNNRSGTPIQLRINGSEKMRITNQGRVGVGVTDPDQRLDVDGTIEATGFKMASGASAGHVLTTDAAGVATWQPPSEFTLPYSGSVSSISSAFEIINTGLGGIAGRFEIDRAIGDGNALYATANGLGTTIVAYQTADGSAGSFTTTNETGAAPALDVRSWGDGPAIYARNYGDGFGAVIFGNVQVKSKVTEDPILELGEGLDYAEGFDVSDSYEITPGSVLVIDPLNPGKLALSRRPYDSRVAGIAAGARGLGCGVRLGVGQFECDVALAGRVYCNVEATSEAVEPGDLLTTSSVPGYAMKASDPALSHGAILGKAMERLERGTKGQILVLVSLH